MRKERWKIIDAMAYSMNPMNLATKVKHQRITSRFDYESASKLKEYLHFIAPTDVVFDEFNVIQTYVFVVCDRDWIIENNSQGVYGLIIEAVLANLELNIGRYYV